MINELRNTKNKFEWLIRALIGIFLALFAYKFYRLFFVRSKLNDYLLSENLLHYEGGYIRRSLLGNLFTAFPQEYWKLVVISFYTLMILIVLVYVIVHSKNIYALLIFLCAPFGLRMVMFDFGSMYRKEFIFLIMIILMIVVYRKYKNHTVNLLLAVVLSALMTMIHESFIFLAMPVIAWILYFNKAGLARVSLYSILTLGCGLIFSRIPMPSQLQMLDHFFMANHIDWSKTREFMTMSRSETFNMSISHFLKGSMVFYLIFFIPIIWYLFHARIMKRDLVLLLLVQLAACILISIIAIDYGRWMSFVMISFFICLFSYDTVPGMQERITSSMKEKLIYLALLVFMMSIYLPHYVKDYDLPKNLAEYSFWEKINYSFSELAKENP